MRRVAAVLVLLAMSAVVACGASEEEIDELVKGRVSVTLTAVPTPTSAAVPTPFPTPP
jgi:hypothetical protein